MKQLFGSRKQALITLALAVVVAVGAIVATTAYLQAKTGTLTNTFTVGNVTTEIEEVISGLEKEPFVKNTGVNDCLVRMRLSISPESLTETVTVKYKKIDGVNTAEWKLEADGFYYYQGVLPVGGKTTPLFDEVDGVYTTDNQGNQVPVEGIEELEITLYQEAVQTAAVNQEGETMNALDDKGVYNHTNALAVWEVYDETNVTP